MSAAMLSLARPNAAEEIAEELDLACNRSPVDGSGSPGSAAPGMSAYALLAQRVGRRGRRLGPRRDAVPRAPRRRSRSRSRRSRRARRPVRRSSSRRRSPASSRDARAQSCSRSSSRCAARSSSPARTGRRRRRDDRVLLAQLGLDPAFLDRRRDPAARRQRARRRRAGSSSRVTSPTGRSPRCGRRSRCCTNVDLDHHTTFGSRAEVAELFEQLARARAAGRARRRARAGRSRARGAGRAQPA